MLLKEQIILNLELDHLEKDKKEKIANEIIEFSLEKAMDELVDNMSEKELEKWGEEKVEEEQKSKTIEKIFELFSKYLEENIYGFRTKIQGTK